MSHECFKIDCDETLIENQDKCVGQNCETWKCETIGEGNRSKIWLQNNF